jgi:hypothetical protein
MEELQEYVQDWIKDQDDQAWEEMQEQIQVCYDFYKHSNKEILEDMENLNMHGGIGQKAK